MANNDDYRQIIAQALEEGRTVLAESESRRVIAACGVPVVEERLVAGPGEAAGAAGELGFPVALKINARGVAHKKDLGLVETGLWDAASVESAAADMQRRAGEEGIDSDGFSVQPMVKGSREFLLGMKREKAFGPCVTFGLGGVFTEVLQDVSVRVAPVSRQEALAMFGELKSAAMLGAFRGDPAADVEELARSVMSLGRLALEEERIDQVDVNPLIIDREGRPAAVDALVILDAGEGE